MRPNPGLRSRIRGCILGGAVGDALGAPIEFMSLAQIRGTYGPDGLDRLAVHPSWPLGAITDDTQMTLFTMEGLLRAGAEDVRASVWAAHRRWYATQVLPGPPADAETGLAGEVWLYARRAPGNACLSGLRSSSMGTPERPANPDSKGCGAVMRSAPFGLIPSWSPERAFSLAAECAVQTHGHPSGYLAAGALAAIIRHLLDGVAPELAVRHTLDLARRTGGGETHDALIATVEAAAAGRPSPERLEQLGQGWVAEEALAMAVYCALTHADDVRSALLLAVNHSGDSDSTGAITGNLLGAWYGEEALPQAWITALEGRQTMERLTDAWLQRFTHT